MHSGADADVSGGWNCNWIRFYVSMCVFSFFQRLSAAFVDYLALVDVRRVFHWQLATWITAFPFCPSISLHFKPISLIQIHSNSIDLNVFQNVEKNAPELNCQLNSFQVESIKFDRNCLEFKNLKSELCCNLNEFEVKTIKCQNWFENRLVWCAGEPWKKQMNAAVQQARNWKIQKMNFVEDTSNCTLTCCEMK